MKKQTSVIIASALALAISALAYVVYKVSKEMNEIDFDACIDFDVPMNEPYNTIACVDWDGQTQFSEFERIK